MYNSLDVDSLVIKLYNNHHYLMPEHLYPPLAKKPCTCQQTLSIPAPLLPAGLPLATIDLPDLLSKYLLSNLILSKYLISNQYRFVYSRVISPDFFQVLPPLVCLLVPWAPITPLLWLCHSTYSTVFLPASLFEVTYSSLKPQCLVLGSVQRKYSGTTGQLNE